MSNKKLDRVIRFAARVYTCSETWRWTMRIGTSAVVVTLSTACTTIAVLGTESACNGPGSSVDSLGSNLGACGGDGGNEGGVDSGMAGEVGADSPESAPPPPDAPPGGPACGLASAAFCDTFDAPAGIGNRSGQLNGTVWGVSRIGDSNLGQGYNDLWYASNQNQCGQNVTVLPESSITICNGVLTESMNDGGGRPALAMYPKQPFDIAGRTGKVVFDVSNDSNGTHAVWPEFWYTDKPAPAPFIPDGAEQSAPRNGLGMRFARVCDGGANYNFNCGCQAVPASKVWNVDSVAVVTNFVDSEFDSSALQPVVTMTDCVTEPTGPDQRNHVELRISQTQIDMYATDAGTTAPLKHIAVITNLSLPLTRGLIWLEHSGYNSTEKGNQFGDHTFTWDNVGFDGPLLPRDLAFDVNDKLNAQPYSFNNASLNGVGSTDLGWTVPSDGSTLSLTVPGVHGVAQASAGLLTFNYAPQSPATISYSLNGNAWHDIPWPFAAEGAGTFLFSTMAQPIALSEVIEGNNTIAWKASAGTAIANVDVILVGAGGIVAP
jgi:hypothetical protein